MNTREEAQRIAARARIQLEKIYGPRLRGVYLFGSCARGEGGEDSDIDIAVVLDDVPDTLAEIERTGDLFSTLSLDAGSVVSRLFVGEVDFHTGRYALYRDIRREGVAV